jgi:hypothetical protein
LLNREPRWHRWKTSSISSSFKGEADDLADPSSVTPAERANDPVDEHPHRIESVHLFIRVFRIVMSDLGKLSD